MIRSLAALSFSMFGAALPLAPQNPPARLDPAEGCTVKCHQALGQGAFLHKPAQEGKCTHCHKQDQPTAHVFAAIDDVGESCRSCHKLTDAAVVHTPYETMDCTTCHDAHRSATKSLLKTKDEPSG